MDFETNIDNNNIIPKMDQNTKTGHRSLTPIQQFYEGKNIFITGATGFLGKLLVEKLLWSCPGIGTIYLLMRNKKGRNVQSRVEELLESQAFCRVKRDVPDFKKKLEAISGDCALPGLGISEEDRVLLIKNVNIIFHVAATVKFNEPLTYATAVNVRATIDILKLSKELENLDSIVHVSTAYANCYISELEEKFYEVPLDPLKFTQFIESSDEQILEDITPKIINKWPNTYTFTKCLAEDYISKNSSGLPVCVYRPSVVVSSVSEPVAGWVDNWYGLSGFITATALGFMRITLVNKEGIPNIVPVDFCVNGLIACGYDTSVKFLESKKIENSINKNTNVQIYNFVLDEKKLTWNDLYMKTTLYGQNTPPLQALWYRSINLQSVESLYRIQRIILHDIPGFIADAVLFCMGKKTMFRSFYKRLHSMTETVTFFALKNWNFTNNNIPRLIDRLTEEDRKLYPCDMRTIEWGNFFKTYFLGVRRYLMKDDDSTIEKAKKRYFKLKILHRIVQFVLLYLFLNTIYNTFSYVISSKMFAV